jgi:hypothetical protein
MRANPHAGRGGHLSGAGCDSNTYYNCVSASGLAAKVKDCGRCLLDGKWMAGVPQDVCQN